MKTFEQYIEEAVDFRLGGKDNKGETLFKTFTELSKGDIFYMYTINNETEEISERGCYFLSIATNGNDELDTLIKYKSNPSQTLVSHTYAPRLMRNEDCSIFIKTFNDWECSYIYSTTKLDEERVRELLKVYRKEFIKRNKNIMVCESVDFRLGGKSSKGDSIKSFSELKNGDVFYYYRVRKDRNEFVIYHYKRIFLDAYETGKKTEIECRIVFENNAKLTAVFNAPNIYKDEDCYIFINVNLDEADLLINSTRELSEDEIAYLYNANQEKAHSLKEDSIIICESVDFRLGGSTNKSGYRTFGMLKPNDVIYEYTVDPEEEYVKLSKYKANSEAGLILKKKEHWNDLIADSSAFVAIGNRWFHTVLYSTYELSREEAIEKTAEAMKNGKEFEFVKVEESVDFRLGGKLNKGFDQYTPIRDLKYRDKLYFYTAFLDKSYECLVKKIKEDDEEEDRLDVDVIQDGESNTLYVRKLKDKSPVCVFHISNGKLGAIFATDEELFLKTCEECGLEVTSRDIIRNEKF